MQKCEDTNFIPFFTQNYILHNTQVSLPIQSNKKKYKRDFGSGKKYNTLK